MSARWSLSFLVILLMVPRVAAGPGVPFKKPTTADLLPLLTGGTTDALAGSIRGFLVRSMPAPLYEHRKDWGRTSPTARGVKWKGLRPQIMFSPKNDGTWRHIVVMADRPADTLIFDIRNLKQPEPGHINFDIYFSMDARVLYEQQNWENGIRFYSGSADARFRVKALLHCEFTWQLEPGGLFLPDAVVRLRVVRSEVSYDNFETTHMAGVGGEAAEVLGDAIRGGLNKWHPSLERDLLTKANRSIEKSADTKEVRLSLQELLKKKGWLKLPASKPAPVPSEPIPAQP
jgi:hypothetical protein